MIVAHVAIILTLLYIGIFLNNFLNHRRHVSVAEW